MNPQRPPNDDIIAGLVPDPSTPPTTLRFFSGFVGVSPVEGYLRLYMELPGSAPAKYWDIAEDGIAHSQPIPVEVSPLGGSYLWVHHDAKIQPSPTLEKRQTVPAGGMQPGLGTDDYIPYWPNWGRNNPPVPLQGGQAQFFRGDIAGTYAPMAAPYPVMGGNVQPPPQNYFTWGGGGHSLFCTYNSSGRCCPMEPQAVGGVDAPQGFKYFHGTIYLTEFAPNISVTCEAIQTPYAQRGMAQEPPPQNYWTWGGGGYSMNCTYYSSGRCCPAGQQGIAGVAAPQPPANYMNYTLGFRCSTYSSGHCCPVG